jgi:hypothetical protein
MASLGHQYGMLFTTSRTHHGNIIYQTDGTISRLPKDPVRKGVGVAAIAKGFDYFVGYVEP